MLLAITAITFVATFGVVAAVLYAFTPGGAGIAGRLSRFMGLIIRLVKEHGKTVLMVTHDPVVAKLADMELHLEKGLLVEGSQIRQGALAGGVA